MPPTDSPSSPFRQAALDRLSSPEQLDRLLVVTSKTLWSTLLGVCLLVGTVLAWSVFGRIPVTVDGSGLLLSADGVREVEALGGGVVEALPFRVGQLVDTGVVIARIRQPLLEQQVAQDRERVKVLREERAQRASFVGTSLALEQRRLAAEQADLERQQRAIAERVRFFETRLVAEREAKELGLVTDAALQLGVQNLEGARSDLGGNRLALQSNAIRRLEIANGGTERVAEVDARLREAERQLAAVERQFAEARAVVSPYRGYVRELRTSVGQLVPAGQALLTIELAGVPLQAVAFVSNDGKRIEPGMEVRVAPSTVQREEYGYLVGRVKSVSTQPMTLAGMTSTLGNDILVQQLAAQGALFMVEIALVPDAATPSGFRWSSRRGPPVRVGSGTTVGVSVVVTRRRPIELLLPFLRSAFGATA